MQSNPKCEICKGTGYELYAFLTSTQYVHELAIGQCRACSDSDEDD